MWKRFIPAGAGNTFTHRSGSGVFAVYPRWRGEHLNHGSPILPACGLSPLARGTHVLVRKVRRNRRFIPAGAGNTPLLNQRWLASAVYPRWRGEHEEYLNQDDVVYGLSPLARGTRGDVRQRRRHVRFIPAGAGNTTAKIDFLPPFSVYPRWRGEHTDREDGKCQRHGLSPLARGTPHPPHTARQRCRFIPAGAGNTIYWSTR